MMGLDDETKGPYIIYLRHYATAALLVEMIQVPNNVNWKHPEAEELMLYNLALIFK